MYWWERFNPGEVEEDFGRIRDAGFGIVRVFLLWEHFQPEPGIVSDEALRRLVTVAAAARSAGLSLLPTLFTGHMSGANWIPRWALDPAGGPTRFPVLSGGAVVPVGIRNWYADEQVSSAQGLLAGEVARALSGDLVLYAWDLGNENSNCCVPPTVDAGRAWIKHIAGEIRAADPSTPITIGLHAEDLEEDRRLGPGEAADVCDFLCMHGYPMYSDWARADTDELTLPFLGLLTSWLGEGKDVFFEEFGAPAVTGQGRPHHAGSVRLLDESEAAAYTRRSMKALFDFGFRGAMLWCFSDYAESLWQLPPLDRAAHERFFGLYRADGSAKSAVDEIKLFAELPRQELSRDAGWIDIPVEDYYRTPASNLRRLYRNFIRCYG